MLNPMKNLFIIFLMVDFVITLKAEVKDDLIGKKAPPISLLRLDNIEFFKSKTLLGKKHIVLCFFATWSVPCALEIPKLQEIDAGINYEDINFFLVNVKETINIVAPFVQDKIYIFPVILDLYGLAFEKFNGLELPLTVVINRDGFVTYYHAGYQDGDELQLLAHLKTL